MLVLLCNIDRHTYSATRFRSSSLIPGQAHGTVAHHAQTKTISISFDARVRKRKMGDATVVQNPPILKQGGNLGTLLRTLSSAVR